MIARSEIPFLTPVAHESSSAAGPVKDAPDGLTVAVRRAQTGDLEAFASVLEQCELRVFHFVLRMVRNAHDAEDVTQETFVKAWRHLASFRPQSSFSTWLFTIARRTALNHLRTRRTLEPLDDQDEPLAASPSDAAADRENADSIWAIARRLKPDQYEALWLCYGEDFSVKEIARIMSTNSLRVRVLLHRARKRLAEWLNPRMLKTGESP